MCYKQRIRRTLETDKTCYHFQILSSLTHAASPSGGSTATFLANFNLKYSMQQYDIMVFHILTIISSSLKLQTQTAPEL
jgi:hypothetical protein